MALKTLETLELGSLATLRGGRNVELRLGTSAEGYPTREIVISMRHPANPVSKPHGPTPWQTPTVAADRQADARVGGAGRSPSAASSRVVVAVRPVATALANALSDRSNPRSGFKPGQWTTAKGGIRG